MRRGDSPEAREAWLARRQLGVGASEVSIVLGVNPWKSNLALWAEKAGLMPALPVGEAAEWGQRFEDPIARATAVREQYAKVIDRGRYHAVQDKKAPHLFATLDREVVDRHGRRGLLEIKLTGRDHENEWQNNAPLHHKVQVQTQLAVVGKRATFGHLTAFIGENLHQTPVLEIEPNREFHELIREEVETFWGYVERKEQPPADGHETTTLALKNLFPEDSGETIALPGEAESWDRERAELMEQLAAATERKEQIDNLIRAALGNATWGTLPGGGRWQWRTEERVAISCPHCKGELEPARRQRVLRRRKK